MKRMIFKMPVIILIVVLLIELSIIPLYYFLTGSDPINADYIVIEGWISKRSFQEAALFFQKQKIKKIIIPIIAKPGDTITRTRILSYINMYHNIGINIDQIIVLEGPKLIKHQTYSAAFLVEKWLKTNQLKPNGINVITENIHGKKSYITYQRVFKNQCPIGIYPVASDKFNEKNWILSKTAIRLIIKNTLGCFYASTISFKRINKYLKNSLNYEIISK